MKEQLKPSVKELYGSVRAPEALREKTLAAVKEGRGEQKKAKILNVSFKALGALAACFLICFGLLFSGIFGGSDMNISVGGNNITSDAVLCLTEQVNYLPEILPLSAKTADGSLTADAIRLDVELDGEMTVSVSGAALATENSQGKICELPQNAEIDGDSVLYVILNGAEEAQVVFNRENGVKTLIITENSDGEYSVGIK